MVNDKNPSRRYGTRYQDRCNDVDTKPDTACLNGYANNRKAEHPVSPSHTRYSYRSLRNRSNYFDESSNDTELGLTSGNDRTLRHSQRLPPVSVSPAGEEKDDANETSMEANDEKEFETTNYKISTRRSLRSTRRMENHHTMNNKQSNESWQTERRSSRPQRSLYQSTRSYKSDNNSLTTEEKNDYDNMDMYTRVKRTRRKIKRDMYGMPLVEEEEKSTEEETEEDGDEEEGDEDGETTTAQYNLRRNKPRTKLYEATIERKQRERYYKDTPPKRKMKEIQFKSPAHRRHKRKKVHHRSSSTSSSGSSDESDDERRFSRRKNKSMAKARQRCLPMNLNQSDLSHTMKDRQKIGASLADIDPMSVDRTVSFDSVGGLGEHLQALKEMIVFPLLYPEVFEKFRIAPPRGVLFHGPPGTGKTLVARALANECSSGEKRVAFFMRKGADCLSKWVGESERQLRLLFDQAYQVRPSIIFFDEIDGLAPVRSSRQDQIHSSIVSTLLALMDGLDSRGEVVVIGATNRIDSIDPALRRPGRFDREFLFNLPPVEARADILRIHTKEWNPKLLDKFIVEVASKCNGYCGADLKALCTEAALHALRRRYPQIYSSSDKLQLDVTSIDISAVDFHHAMTKIVPAGQRAITSPSRPLSAIIKPLLQRQLDIIFAQLSTTFPYMSTATATSSFSLTSHLLDAVNDDSSVTCVTECSKSKRKSKQGPESGPFLDFSITAYSRPIVNRPRLLVHGDPCLAHSSHLAPALLHSMENIPVHTLDVPTLYSNSAKTPEEACSQVFREARRSTPSVIYIPHICKWWHVLSDTMQATFHVLLNDLDPLIPILVLATADTSSHSLPVEILRLFGGNSNEMYQVTKPSEAEIRHYFEDLLLRQTCVPPPTKKQAARNLLEVLPKVPVSRPATLTDAEEKTLWQEEESVLRELRLFLRDMLNKLARDKKFNIFSKPVDIEEVPDYHDIIKEPMDLSTMMSKIDLHKYQACREFLDDIDLICANALEYNPANSIAGRAIRHRACALKDMAHALISAELDEDFEKQCLDILESRKNRGKSPSKSAPKYYHTKPISSAGADGAHRNAPAASRYSKRLKREEVSDSVGHLDNGESSRVSHDITQDDITPAKKRKRSRSRWSRGLPPRKSRKCSENEQREETDEDEDKEPVNDSLETNGHASDEQSSPAADVDGAKRNLNTAIDDVVASRECEHNGVASATGTELGAEDLSEESRGSRDSEQLDSETQIETVTDVALQSIDIETKKEFIELQQLSVDVRPIEIIQLNEKEMGVEGEAMGSADASVSPSTGKQAELAELETVATLVNENAESSNIEPLKATSPIVRETIVELPMQSSPQPKRLTRSMTNDPHVIKCMEILEEPTPTFTINETKLPILLNRAVLLGKRCNISELEKIYSLLAQQIYKHRFSYDRAALVEDLFDVLDRLMAEKVLN